MKHIFSATISLLALLVLGRGDGFAQPVVKGRALLVGVSTYQDPRISKTPGAVEDAEKLKQFIQEKYGFAHNSIKVLLNREATASNIRKQIQEWLIDGTQPGERIFFSYSGHGSQLPSPEKNELYESTLAPYDVNPETGANMIRKSEIKALVAQMTGRMAVLLFDSCHSGTITRSPSLSSTPKRGSSRYLPRPDQFLALQQAASAPAPRSELVAAANTRSRGLGVRPLLDTNDVTALAGLVVLCAAGPEQLAYSMPVGAEERGALSYLFEETQRRADLTLRQLQEMLVKRIAELHQSGRLEGEQVPWFDITTQMPLEDQPLFGTWDAIPAAALLNPSAKIKLALRLVDQKKAYQIGDLLTYQVTTDTPGYLYLLAFSQQNVATCVFPNKAATDNKITAGTHLFPGAQANFLSRAQPPLGRDVIVALLSKEPLEIGINDVRQNRPGAEFTYTWQEAFDRVPLPASIVKMATRGGRGLRLAADKTAVDSLSWQGASVSIETIEKVK